MAKTVLALYDDPTAAYRAVRELLALGLTRDDVGVLESDAIGGDALDHIASRRRVRESLDAGNAVIGGMTGAIVGLGIATVPVIGPILAGVPFALGAIGATVGERFGTWFEALSAFGIPPDDVDAYAEAIRRGGVLVTARVHEDWLARVVDLLGRTDTVDLAARVADWRREGFVEFDASAPRFTEEEVRRERARRAEAIPYARDSEPPDRPSRPSLPM